jgi:Asparagine synthase (glutamine-hydrolyzing)
VAKAALALARRLRPKHTHVSIPHLVERFLDARAMDPLDRHLAWFGTATPDLARGLLAPGLRQPLGQGEERGYLRDFAARAAEAQLPGWPGHPGLLVWQLLDFDLYLGGGLLTKVDRCTMAHSVESRAPFLRHGLIRFALGLPDDARLRGKTGKRALRLAAQGLLPPAILTRRKQGFSPPFSVWARGPLQGLVEARLAPERLRAAGVLDVEATGRVLAEHMDCRAERGRTLWALLSLQMWAERWIAGNPH